MARGVDSAESLGGAEERRRLEAALAELLAAAARERPLAVLIDDAQWADDESLETLTRLLPLLRDERVLLLFTLHSDEAAGRAPLAALRAALTRPPCRKLRLDYLTPEAIAAILGAMAERASAPPGMFRG